MLSHVFRCDDCFLGQWNWPIRLSNTRDEDPLHDLSPLLASVVSTVRLRRFPKELLFGYLTGICFLCFNEPGNSSAAPHYTYTEHQDGHWHWQSHLIHSLLNTSTLQIDSCSLQSSEFPLQSESYHLLTKLSLEMGSQRHCSEMLPWFPR